MQDCVLRAEASMNAGLVQEPPASAARFGSECQTDLARLEGLAALPAVAGARCSLVARAGEVGRASGSALLEGFPLAVCRRRWVGRAAALAYFPYSEAPSSTSPPALGRPGSSLGRGLALGALVGVQSVTARPGPGS